MSRVTPAEVKAIVTTSLIDSVIQTWIDVANTIINENAACISGAEALLTQIELQLSAHYIAMLDANTRGYITKEKTEMLETTYSNPVAMINNLDNTTFGTAANALSKGCLANISDQAIGFFSAGTDADVC